MKVTNAYAKSLVAASLYVDYVFLDTDERRRMAQNPHEYLIEQLQFTGDESIGSSSNKIKLNFNHPCKELVFVVQPDMHVAYCDSFLAGRLMHRALELSHSITPMPLMLFQIPFLLLVHPIKPARGGGAVIDGLVFSMTLLS